MELEEVVTKIINYIDESTVKTKRETIQEVNVLLEQQRSQFNTFGEGLDTLRDQMNRGFDDVERRFDNVERRFDEMERRFDQNDSEHQNLKLMIQELAVDQKTVQTKLTDLDQEFETKIRRVK